LEAKSEKYTVFATPRKDVRQRTGGRAGRAPNAPFTNLQQPATLRGLRTVT
jgi:hypothetical protein